MQTFQAAKKQAHALAFEIENIYVSRVSDVSLGGRLGSSNDVRIEFKYRGHDYVVWEPFGDNSRYWIGPKNPEESAADIAQLENAFKRYRPPFYREVLGDLFTLRFLRRKKDDWP